MMKPTRIVVLGLALAAATVAATGCGPDVTTTAAGPSTAPASQSPATGHSTARTSSPPATVGDGCPVDAQTLLTALRRDAQRYDSINRPTAVRDVTCYHGYATALEAPAPNTETAAIVYRYSTRTGTWTVLDVGTSIGCLSLGIPADVTAHLPSCGGY